MDSRNSDMMGKERYLILILTIGISFLLTEHESQGQLSAGCNDGDIRIAGGPNEFEGRVEICLGVEWGQVCGNSGWDRFEGQVVCRQQQFNYSYIFPTSAGNRYGSISNGSFIIDNVMCQGSESRLSDCEYMITRNSSVCPSNLDAQIVCLDPVCTSSSKSSTIRLVGGGTSGRVEVCRVGGMRRGVCANNWDENDARVVCRELGLLEEGTEPLPTSGPQFVSIASAYDNVECSGDEERLSQCQFDQTTSILTRCAAAGVVCQTDASTTSITTSFSSSQEPTSPLTDRTIMEIIAAVTTPITITESSSLSPTLADPVVHTDIGSIIIGILAGVSSCVIVGIVIVVVLLVLILVCIRNKKNVHTVERNSNEIRPDLVSNETHIELKPNEAYQVPKFAGIVSTQNEAYGAFSYVESIPTTGDDNDIDDDYEN